MLTYKASSFLSLIINLLCHVYDMLLCIGFLCQVLITKTCQTMSYLNKKNVITVQITLNDSCHKHALTLLHSHGMCHVMIKKVSCQSYAHPFK